MSTVTNTRSRIRRNNRQSSNGTLIAMPAKSRDRKTKAPPPAPMTGAPPSDDEDTDLEYDEDVLLHRIHKDRSDCRTMYVAACKRFDAVISSQFIAHMKGTRVHLTDLALGPLDMKTMCIPLLYNTTVSVVDFSGNNLGNKGVIHVMDMLRENIRIEELHLARNNISRSGARYICSSLSINHKIRTLDLSGNSLRDGEAKYFAELLRSNSAIKSLDLSKNQLGEESGEILGAVLAENGALEELDLSWNHIRLHGAVALAGGLRDNDTLKRLDVSWNGFTNEGAAEMGLALSENFTLRELNMNSNRINLVGLGHLAKGITDNEGLHTLKLGDNPILALGAEMILQVIQQSETSKVDRLEIEHVPVSYNFAATLDELNADQAKLSVKHDCKIRHADDLSKQPGCLIADPVRVILMYVKERGPNLTDALVTCPESGVLCVDEMPFKSAIRKLNPPLNEPQIEALSKRLHKFGDDNQFLGVDISSLVDHAEYREKRSTHLSILEQRSRASEALDSYRADVEQVLPENTTLGVDGSFTSRNEFATPFEEKTVLSGYADGGSEYGSVTTSTMGADTKEPETLETTDEEPSLPNSEETDTIKKESTEHNEKLTELVDTVIEEE